MFFDNCSTVAEVKSLYRKLAMKHHPDRGGSHEMMKKVNAAYHSKLKAMNGQTSRSSSGKKYTYRYNQTVEQAVMDKISQVLKMNMPGVEVELIGTWVWVYGDTKPHKEELKGLKFRWQPHRQKWYFHTGKRYRRRASKLSFNDMRQIYGSRKFESENEARLTI